MLKNFDNKVVYQIYPKSFMDSNGDGIGDIPGIISKLDYIKNLGVDYIWLSPVCKSPQNDNGYDIADYYTIDKMFGTNEDYFELIKSVKKLDMKVMMDLVLNHTSSEHEWFKKALSGDKYYQDFYIFRDEPNSLESYFSTSAWSYCEEVGKYYLHFFDPTQPDLNWENENVRKEIYKMINYWIDNGVEGFRLDVIDLIGKNPDKLIGAKGPRFLEFLQELHDNTFQDKILTVGECWGASLQESLDMCTNGLTQVFHFEHLITTNKNGDKFDQLPVDYNKIISVIEKWQNHYEKSQTWVIENHDMPRLVSLWLNDQDYRYESATLLATLFSLLKGTQYIYQGEEIGAVNVNFETIEEYNDVETHNYYKKSDKSDVMNHIKKVSRDNARVNMNWNNDLYGGFSEVKPWLTNPTKINVDSDLNSDKSVYKYYQKLIKFKKENYDNIIDAKLDSITFENNLIKYSKNNLTVVCNMSEDVIFYECEDDIIFNNYDKFNNKLQPYQAIVILKK